MFDAKSESKWLKTAPTKAIVSELRRGGLTREQRTLHEVELLNRNWKGKFTTRRKLRDVAIWRM